MINMEEEDEEEEKEKEGWKTNAVVWTKGVQTW
jgi:hypothetical protein